MNTLLATFTSRLALALVALALLGQSSSQAQNLYVANNSGGTVTDYNATTGGAPAVTISSGVSGPSALLLSGNNLYVANVSANSVTEYNATTGAPLLTISTGASSAPSALALSGNNLYVANYGVNTVTEYDATAGGAPTLTISSGVNGPLSLAIAPEPGSWLLFAGGLGLVGGFRRRRA